MLVSLNEIGADLYPSFVSELLTACCEQKKDAINKSLNLLKELRENYISLEVLLQGFLQW